MEQQMEGRRCSSDAKVKGQVRLAHLLPVDTFKLVVHGHCEDVLPESHAACMGSTWLGRLVGFLFVWGMLTQMSVAFCWKNESTSSRRRNVEGVWCSLLYKRVTLNTFTLLRVKCVLFFHYETWAIWKSGCWSISRTLTKEVKQLTIVKLINDFSRSNIVFQLLINQYFCICSSYMSTFQCRCLLFCFLALLLA